MSFLLGLQAVMFHACQPPSQAALQCRACQTAPDRHGLCLATADGSCHVTVPSYWGHSPPACPGQDHPRQQAAHLFSSQD